MRWARGLVGFFVGDGPASALVVAWVVAGCLLLGGLGEWSGPVLFLGLAAIGAATMR